MQLSDLYGEEPQPPPLSEVVVHWNAGSSSRTDCQPWAVPFVTIFFKWNRFTRPQLRANLTGSFGWQCILRWICLRNV